MGNVYSAYLMLHPPRDIYSTMNPLVMRDVSGTRYSLSETRHYAYTVYHNGAYYGMIALASVLLVFCSLLAGLTLAVCGLDMTLLHLRSITGPMKQRKQALVVARMKCHGSWMLCSLIICTVACGESLPAVIQSVWHGDQQWVPILISTLTIAVFAEILPQYIIPRHAITWGYFCCPVIWGCMWLTCIISFPLAWLLDHLSGSRDENGIFTNEEMVVLLKYHERSEKHGGMLGQDALRVMLGALKLDSRRIGGDIAIIPEKNYDEGEKDIEKADLLIVQGMIVKWPLVKTVNIDDRVDMAFIKKVKGWSYSRIPVIGGPQPKIGENYSPTSWEGKKIFGFLHIKNLVGLNIKQKYDSINELFVRDLPLYPLPIIQDDMAVYDLLNLFQLGMSRMAVVIPTPPKTALASITVSSASLDKPISLKTPRWTATDRTNARILSRMKAVAGEVDWTTDFIDAARATSSADVHRRQSVLGIRSPKPVGIVTFEGLIDTILQKTSRDERDFFDRDTNSPPTKAKKTGDYPSKSSIQRGLQNSSKFPTYGQKSSTSFQNSIQQGTLRRRNVSNNEKAGGAMDGVDERSIKEEYGRDIKLEKLRNNQGESSYTEDSRGGFHGSNQSRISAQNLVAFSAEELTELVNLTIPVPPGQHANALKALSLPSRKCKTAALPEDFDFLWRHASDTPSLQYLRHVTPFSRQHYSSYGSMQDEETVNFELVLPEGSLSPSQNPPKGYNPEFDVNASGIDVMDPVEDSILKDAKEGAREDSADTVSLSSCYEELDESEEDNTGRFNATPVKSAISVHENHYQAQGSLGVMTAIEAQTKPYDGFPMELLDIGKKKENHITDFASKILPRMIGHMADLDAFGERRKCETPSREESFHDDRALLPSQHRILNGTANVGGARSSSLWF